MIKYTIMGAPVTKKNSQRIVQNKATGRSFVMPSKQYKEYEDAAIWQLTPKPAKPIETPVNVCCVYYMPTRRRVDLTNLLSATDDILVRAGVLADDHSGILAAHDGSRVRYSKVLPRVVIEITSLTEDEL